MFQGEPIVSFFEWGMGEWEGDPGIVVVMEEESDGDRLASFDEISDGVFGVRRVLEEFEPDFS